MLTLVLVTDPSDGNDRIWSFDNSMDAEYFACLNNDYYMDSIYCDMTVAKVVNKADNIPEHSAPNNCLDGIDWLDEDSLCDNLDAWIDQHESLYSVEV